MQVTTDDDDAFDLGASPDIKSAGPVADLKLCFSMLCGGNLEGFVRIDQLESLMPIMDMKVVTLSEEETPQILVTPCGRGPSSSLRILRPWTILASRWQSHSFPRFRSAVWTVKRNVNDEFDAYIVISFFLLAERLLKSLQSLSSPSESLLYLEVEASLFLNVVGLQSGVLFSSIGNAVIFQMDGLGFSTWSSQSVVSAGERKTSDM
ncbi:spliceosome-associated protein 130 A [Tanacetum coccineum]